MADNQRPLASGTILRPPAPVGPDLAMAVAWPQWPSPRGSPMLAEDETHAGFPLDPLDQLRHDLRSPLTTIRGRAYLLARAVRRAPALTDDERTRMLAGVAAIETAVAAMVAVIEGIDGERPAPDSDAARDRT